MPYVDPDAARLNSGFAVAINITAKEGKGDEVARILESLIAPTMAEKKVKFFVPYRSPTDPLSFFVYELYEDEAGWEAHNKAPHFLRVVDEIGFPCSPQAADSFCAFRRAMTEICYT